MELKCPKCKDWLQTMFRIDREWYDNLTPLQLEGRGYCHNCCDWVCPPELTEAQERPRMILMEKGFYRRDYSDQHPLFECSLFKLQKHEYLIEVRAAGRTKIVWFGYRLQKAFVDFLGRACYVERWILLEEADNPPKRVIDEAIRLTEQARRAAA